MRKFATIAAIAATALATTAPAVAAPTPGAWKVGNDSYHLYLTGLDLHTAAGRAEALVRVEKVAAKLCGHGGLRSDQRECVAATVKRAVQGSAAQAIQMAQTERNATTLVWAGK